MPMEYEKIIAEYEASLYRVASLLTNNKEDAEVLVINTFLHMKKEIASLPKENDLFHEFFSTNAVIHMYHNIPTLKKRKEASSQHELVELHFLQLEQTEQQSLLLYYLFKLSFPSISKLLNVPTNTLENVILTFHQEISHKPNNADCLSIETTTKYTHHLLSPENRTEVEDHLEFCPACRSLVDETNGTMKKVQAFIQPNPLETPFAEKAIAKTQDKTRKKKSLAYQLLTAASIVLLFGLIVLNMPKFEGWTKLATNYVKYGDFYNVWEEGTYVAEASGVSFEITGVEITPVLMRVDFRIENERERVLEFVDNEQGNHLISTRFTGESGLFNLISDEEEHRISNLTLISTNEEATEGSFFLDITKGMWTLEEIPEAFDLRFTTSRIGGVFGPWEVTVPILYKDGMKKANTIELDQKVSVGELFDISLLEWTTSSTGNVMKTRIDTSEALRESRANDQKYIESVQLKYKIETEQGEALLQHPYGMFSFYVDEYSEGGFYELDSDESIYEQAFHPYTYKMVEGNYHTTKYNKEPLYFSLYEVTMSERTDFSFPLQLKEVDKEPMNITFDGTIFEYLTVVKEEGEERITYRVTITGKEENPRYERSYYFDMEYVEHEDPYAYYFLSDQGHDIQRELAEFSISVPKDHIDTVYINARYVSTTIRMDEPVRVPVY
ncbi:zf-HC2 domain-containing protein [Bacillus sp. FJAT-45066]|uniref:zf-HC2 domain-containing protein n=1 Tax=Bacillus sp. FJAT-45066 TaxID=2011010 RepID=UPI000BB73C5D|nr:zf-HC2 domain-containing protein [Bacillus sp. FJAT-45066]